jgi:hypothetical protein
VLNILRGRMLVAVACNTVHIMRAVCAELPVGDDARGNRFVTINAILCRHFRDRQNTYCDKTQYAEKCHSHLQTSFYKCLISVFTKYISYYIREMTGHVILQMTQAVMIFPLRRVLFFPGKGITFSAALTLWQAFFGVNILKYLCIGTNTG